MFNLHDMITDKVVDDAVAVEALARITALLKRRVLPMDGEALVRTIAPAVFKKPYKLQLASNHRPAGTVTLAAVKPFAEIRKYIENIQGVRRSAFLDNILASNPPDATMHDAATVLNAVEPFQTISVSGNYNIFWATVATELHTRIGSGTKSAADCARDILGLGHIHPDDRDEPTPLFLFTAKASIDDISAAVAVRVARPSALDGFDNARFRQIVATGSTSWPGCGETVDLSNGKFANGLPEIVSSAVPLHFFTCSYLGRVKSGVASTDKSFASFIRKGRKTDDVLRDLNGRL